MEINKYEIRVLIKNTFLCVIISMDVIILIKQEISKWKFGINNEELINLVLDGKKIATTSLFNNKITPIGEESIILHDDNSYACKIKINKVIITKFKDVTEEEAKLEGEGDLSFTYWRNVHKDYFNQFANFDEDMLVMI